MSRTAILESLDLPMLAREIREVNEANGWREGDRFDWSDGHKIPSALALIHSEISEAWIGHINGDWGNVDEELADVAIRVIDMLDGLGIDPYAATLGSTDKQFPIDIGDEFDADASIMHYFTSEALEAFRKDDKSKFTDMTGNVMVVLIDFFVANVHEGSDLAAEIRAKVEKNRARGYRHGGKRV